MSRDGNFPRQRDGVLGPNCGFTHTVLGQMAFSPTWIYFLSWGMETLPGPSQSPNAGASA
jgi:hypothetical protein